MKKIIINFTVVIVSFIIIFLCGEITIRIYQYFTYYQPNRNNKASKHNKSFKVFMPDDILGWRTIENIEFHRQRKDASGQKYTENYHTSTNGFRIYGNPNTPDKIKILFIGDSYTQAQVSNDKTFFGLLKDTLPIEVFAYGSGGYGTLQEYMILDKYIDIIEPDVVILQFCYNDFINNHYELELRSNINSNSHRRPYLIGKGNQIVYKTPKYLPHIREFANNYSRFLYFIFNRIDKLRSKYYNSIEYIIEDNGRSNPFFIESIEITNYLFNKIKSRVHEGSLLFSFSVDDITPYYEEYINILNKNGIEYIDGVPQALRKAEQNDITVRIADKHHLNEIGNKIVSEILSQHIKQKIHNWHSK